VIRNPYPGTDHHQKLITSRGSPLAHAYRVWSRSVTASVSCNAHSTTDRMTERPHTLLRQPRCSNKCWSIRFVVTTIKAVASDCSLTFVLFTDDAVFMCACVSSDEIYCQLCCVVTKNPSQESRHRGWMLHLLCAGCFLPSIEVCSCMFAKNTILFS